MDDIELKLRNLPKLRNDLDPYYGSLKTNHG